MAKVLRQLVQTKKTPMKGKRFTTIEKIKNNRNRSCWRFRRVSRIGKKRWHKSIISEGGYFESDKIRTLVTGHYNPSVRISDLVSHTTYVVCVNFIHITYSLKSTLNDVLRNFS